MITIAFIGLEQVSYEIDMATTPKNNSEQLTPEITAFPAWAPGLLMFRPSAIDCCQEEVYANWFRIKHALNFSVRFRIPSRFSISLPIM